MYIDVPLHYWQEPACCATCEHLKYIQTETNSGCHICRVWGELTSPHNPACEKYIPKHK